MTQDEMKKAAGWAALKYVVPGSIVGVGTGSTVNHFIDALATMKDEIKGAVSSSVASTERLKGFGDLPFCVISSPVRSELPDDSVIRSSTQIAGNTSFEELVGRDNILEMNDEIRQRLLLTIEGL